MRCKLLDDAWHAFDGRELCKFRLAPKMWVPRLQSLCSHTGGIAVFEAGRGRGPGSFEQLNRFVNLALYAGFGSGLPGYDPLVLDLDGDGFDLTTEGNSAVWFDYRQDGFAKHTGWLRGDDGFLVRDANGNGQIDNVTEMFGNATTSGFAGAANDNGKSAWRSAPFCFAKRFGAACLGLDSGDGRPRADMLEAANDNRINKFNWSVAA